MSEGMKDIHIQVIPHAGQRYETIGDYFTMRPKSGPVEEFRISSLSDERYEHLVMVHELVERILCHHRGISNEAIDKFDLDFEMRSADGEPGDDTECPNRAEHAFATRIERLLCEELGVSWTDYENACLHPR